MPATIAPLVGLALGVALSSVTPEQGGRRPVQAHATGVVTLFSLLVFTPATIYFLAFAPDWSLAYLVDPNRLPRVADLSLVLASAASAPLGFTASAHYVGRSAARLRIAAGLATLVAAIVLVGLPRLGVMATHAQFHGDFGVRPIAGSSLGWALLWIDGVVIAATLVTARALRGESLNARRGGSRSAGALRHRD